jgi:DNA-binding XRE family transcriptional regulator
MHPLRQFREQADLSRGELALAVGLKTAGAIEHYEADRRSPPLKIARKIVAVLVNKGVDCSLDKVFPPQNFSTPKSADVPKASHRQSSRTSEVIRTRESGQGRAAKRGVL